MCAIIDKVWHKKLNLQHKHRWKYVIFLVRPGVICSTLCDTVSSSETLPYEQSMHHTTTS